MVNSNWAFPPAWEAWIYAHPPRTAWDLIPQVAHLTLGIRGVETDTLVQEAWEAWREEQPAATFIEVAGAGHLLPMEKPYRLANLIGEFLSALS